MSTAPAAASVHLQVPVIDIRPFLEGTAAGKAQVASEVARACEDIGFFTMAGHGVADSLIRGVYDQAWQFFDLPLDEKMQLAVAARGGYRPSEARAHGATADKPAPGDLRESLAYGPDFDSARWPSTPAGLRPAAEAYFHAMEALAAQLLHISALALRLPEDVFDEPFVGASPTLNIVNYPDQEEEPLPGQLRSGAHTDWGCLTILRIDDAPGGLQVRNKQGDWVDVKAVPGTFIINIGDMLMRWTNDRWISNLHRVVNPPRDVALGSRRQSLVFFYSPRRQAVVQCLESCTGPDNPPRYPPITAGAYLDSKHHEVSYTTPRDAPPS